MFRRGNRKGLGWCVKRERFRRGGGGRQRLRVKIVFSFWKALMIAIRELSHIFH